MLTGNTLGGVLTGNTLGGVAPVGRALAGEDAVLASAVAPAAATGARATAALLISSDSTAAGRTKAANAVAAVVAEAATEDARAAGLPSGAGVATAGAAIAVADLVVHGMTCHSCVQSVTVVLQDTRGVLVAFVDLDAERATVAFDPTVVSSVAVLEDAVDDAGFVVDRSATAIKPAAARLLALPSVLHGVPTLTPSAAPVTASDGSASAGAGAGAGTGMAMVSPPSQTISQCVTLDVRGMTCTSCVANIERHLAKKAGSVLLPLTRGRGGRARAPADGMLTSACGRDGGLAG